MILAKMLSEAGHSVIQAENGEVAILRLVEGPELIVCDLLMPKVDGFGVLAHLRKVGLSIPLIIASADIHSSTKHECSNLGAVGFVEKPYRYDRLCEAVEAVSRAA